MFPTIPDNTAPVDKVQRIFRPTKKGQAQVSRTQYPLTIAEGMTIHKMQGQSTEIIVVSLGDSMERSLLYVALSRATTLNELYLIKWKLQSTSTTTC